MKRRAAAGCLVLLAAGVAVPALRAEGNPAWVAGTWRRAAMPPQQTPPEPDPVPGLRRGGRAAGIFALSADGGTAVYATRGGTRVVVEHLSTRQVRRVWDLKDGPANDQSMSLSLSADGTRAALPVGLPGDPDQLVVLDIAAGAVLFDSILSPGSHGYAGYEAPALSGDGRAVAFASPDRYLVERGGLLPQSLPFAGGGNVPITEIYLRDVATGEVRLVTGAPGGAAADGPSSDPAVSWDGTIVAFASEATNLVPGDTNGVTVIFV